MGMPGRPGGHVRQQVDGEVQQRGGGGKLVGRDLGARDDARRAVSVLGTMLEQAVSVLGTMLGRSRC